MQRYNCFMSFEHKTSVQRSKIWTKATCLVSCHFWPEMHLWKVCKCFLFFIFLQEILRMPIEFTPERLEMMRKYAAIYRRFDSERAYSKPMTLHEVRGAVTCTVIHKCFYWRASYFCAMVFCHFLITSHLTFTCLSFLWHCVKLRSFILRREEIKNFILIHWPQCFPLTQTLSDMSILLLQIA